MILIADSGSTKTDWRLVADRGIVDSFTTVGINPSLQSLDEIKQEQHSVLKAFVGKPIVQLDFYGAGCGQLAAQTKITQMFRDLFPDAKTNIASDLLGAAKAVFDNKPGIACILGTGSNSGHYDGKQIIKNVPSLGYLLGDEGSGNQIGKQLLIDFLRGNMPKALSDILKSEIGDDRGIIYHRLYQSPFPNRFLASIVRLVSKDHSDDIYFESILKQEFDRFFVNCISQYAVSNETPVGFVGSLAYHFQDTLSAVAAKHSIEITGIIEKPIDELAKQCAKQLASGWIKSV